MIGKIFKKIINLIEKLSSKPRIDGIEITGSAIKYSYFDGLTARTVAVKLSPGVVVGGKLSDKDNFSAALLALKGQIMPEKRESIFRVNVVLPTALVFTQSFSVPNLNPDEVAESVNLNLQMISPIPKEDANMSAQLISEHDLDYEFFGAFADKKEIGSYQSALTAAGFVPVSFEFKAVSLSRFIRNTSVVPSKLVLVFELSADGIELFILISGNVYFSYFRSWQSIQGNSQSISKELFDMTVIEEVRKVLNFTSGKFGVSPDSVLILAPGFESEVSDILKTNFNLKTSPIVSSKLNAQPIFYSTIGAAMRWQSEEDNKNLLSINLGGEDLTKAIYNEQILNFVSLWRGILASVLSLVLLAYIGGAVFVVDQYKLAMANLDEFKPPLDETKLANLIGEANTFNSMVSEIAGVRGSNQDFYTPIKHVSDIANANNIKVLSIGVTSLSSPITLSANAASYELVLNFKNAISADPMFTNVDLPLTQINTQSDNSVDFSISFNLKQ